MNNGLFVGLITIDLQFLVERYPGSNAKVKAKKNEICIGGPATNAAITYSYLSGNSFLISEIGKNNFTSFIKNKLSAYKINYFDLISGKDNEATIASIITSENNGDRTIFSHHPQKSVINKKIINKKINYFDLISGKDNEATIASIITSENNGDRTIFSHHPQKSVLNSKKINKKIIEQANIILLDSFYLDAANYISKIANEFKISVVLDGGSWKEGLDETLNYVDIVICSNDFFPPGINSNMEVITYLTENYSIDKVAITRGENSIIYYDKGKIKEIKPLKIKVKDTLGAGDIFHGAFCFYYNQSKNFEKSLIQASEIASRSCQFFGTKEWMK